MMFENQLSKFSRNFWITLGVFLVFAIVFVIYVQSEKQIDHANEVRFRSHELSDEFRQSSDALTRMSRTYVATGNPIYRQYYQEILDIRDGKIVRPEGYQSIDWHAVVATGQRQELRGGRAIALLDLMRELGVPEAEYSKLAQAKARSDALTMVEIKAMDMIDSATELDSPRRRLATAMLFDDAYHQAKSAIMGPVSDFHQMMEQRTLAQVHAAERLALQLRLLFVCLGLLLVGLLWRAYYSLFATLGGTAGEVHTHLMQLGGGDFSSAVAVPQGLHDSVMGWLSVTQQKLADIDEKRRNAVARSLTLTQLYNALSQCNQAIVRSASEAELFEQVCHDTVLYGGMKMAWIGLIDSQSKQLTPVAAAGEGLDYLKDKVISVDHSSPVGNGPSGIAAREGRPYWCQDFLQDPATAPWHDCGIEYNWGSSAALPLHKNGVLIGTFNMYAGMVNAFDEEVRQLLTEMSMDISYALNRFEMEAERQRSQQMEELRIFMLERIAKAMPRSEMFNEVNCKLESLIPDSLCSILLLDPDGVHIRIGATQNFPDFYNHAIDGLAIGIGVGSCGNAMATGCRTVVEDIATHPNWLPYRELAAQAGLAACWSEPIISSCNKVLGAFAIYHRKPTVPTNFYLQVLEMVAHFIAIAIERKEVDANLRKLSQALEQSPNVIIITDNQAQIEYVNAAFVAKTGFTLTEVQGKKPSILQSGKTPLATYQDMWAQLASGESWRGELINRYKSGADNIDSVHISPLRDTEGQITHYLSVQEDISDKRRSEERIQHLANYDALTGLPNRVMLDERAKIALALARRNQESLALMFFDLDHFKDINDTLGHTLGNALLAELARRLLLVLREEDTLSRLGGDDFILLLPGTDSVAAELTAQKILQVVSESYQIGQYDLNVTASLGIAIYPYDGTDLETLARNADAAMYRAKQDGRNGLRFFTQEMQASSARQLEVVNALRYALERNQLQVVYQPQLSLADGSVIGAEALLRWQHPELGIVSPAEFIPMAEKSGLILPIGEWVLRTAVRQVKSWHEQGLTSLAMAVNLSAVQFRHADLPDLVTQILEQHGLAPAFLELELTEGVAMTDPLGAIAIMDDLHERGVRMSIDDFGTGYSSLNYLKKFKVYKLKIDQSFVRDIASDTEDKAIVSAVIAIAQSLGLQTIAEGVETAEQLEFLREQGCNEIQGYYFSRPLDAVQFAGFLREKNGSASSGLVRLASLA
ncbi:EAL domain-containing protein [Undibacterium piscinae]|uniref:EAL domain-containing protein n=1 Tax=Undibacterium piscinae TaxID=2495591 RepID=A0A6M4A3Y8_9BURK|nr:EAL domain-containing protein [Undibacterium piscinae]